MTQFFLKNANPFALSSAQNTQMRQEGNVSFTFFEFSKLYTVYYVYVLQKTVEVRTELKRAFVTGIRLKRVQVILFHRLEKIIGYKLYTWSWTNIRHLASVSTKGEA